jgi:hypothetical protein
MVADRLDVIDHRRGLVGYLSLREKRKNVASSPHDDYFVSSDPLIFLIVMKPVRKKRPNRGGGVSTHPRTPL